MQVKTVRIPNKDGGYTELTREKLKELVETSTPKNFYIQMKTYDYLGVELILQSEFGKTYLQMRVDYVKSIPDLESSIIEMASPQDFMDRYHIDDDTLNIALREKFGGTFIEVKVLGKFRKNGIKEHEIKAAIAASTSQQALADQINETRHNLIQFLRIRFKANYYEVKHEGATSRQIIEFYKRLWDEEGYDSLPRAFLQDCLGQNWKKKLENKDAGSRPSAVIVPFLQEIPDMKAEEITSKDLIELVPKKTIEELRGWLNKPSIEETLSYIKKKVGKPYGYIVLDSYATKEEFLQRVTAADSIEKFYQVLFLTEEEFAKYIRQRFITKLSDQNQVVSRINSHIPLEVLIEAVRNDGVVKKPKRQIQTIGQAELRQRIIDAETIEDLLSEFNITVSVLHRVIAERFEKETYLEIKLSNVFKSKDDLHAAIKRTEKLSDLADELNVEALPLAQYIKKRLEGETFSHIKLKSLSDEQMEQLFSKSNTRAKLLNFLKISCGAGREDAVKFLISKYGKNWEANLAVSNPDPQSVKKEVGKRRRDPDVEPGVVRAMPPEPPAAAGRPTSIARTLSRNSSVWQKTPRTRTIGQDLDDDEEFENDPVWGEILSSFKQ